MGEAVLDVVRPQLQEEPATDGLLAILHLVEDVIWDDVRFQVGVEHVQQVRVREEDLQSQAVLCLVIAQPRDAGRRAELQDHRCLRALGRGRDAHGGALHRGGVPDRQPAHLLHVLGAVAAKLPADAQVGALLSGHDLLTRLRAAMVRPLAAAADVAFERPRPGKLHDEPGPPLRRPANADAHAARVVRLGEAVRGHPGVGRGGRVCLAVREVVDALQGTEHLGGAHRVGRVAEDVIAECHLVARDHHMRNLEDKLRLVVIDDRDVRDVIAWLAAVLVAAVAAPGVRREDLRGQVAGLRGVDEADLSARHRAPHLQRRVDVRGRVRIEVVRGARAVRADDAELVAIGQAIPFVGEAEDDVRGELPPLGGDGLRPLDGDVREQLPVALLRAAGVQGDGAVADRDGARLGERDRVHQGPGVEDNLLRLRWVCHAEEVQRCVHLGGQALRQLAVVGAPGAALVVDLLHRVGHDLQDASLLEAKGARVGIRPRDANDAWLVHVLDHPLGWEV
mmetsp:Transcript_11874/g.30427  ORF Transcript_11874/g.30427 Transcript_11874/m.30427 type:complete len:508 (+) Transcript_11874:6693-8216(+)